jgi:hypothetical protein
MTIAMDDLAKQPPEILKAVSVYNNELENLFSQRSTTQNRAQLDKGIRETVTDMKEALDGILDCLVTCGFSLEHHYPLIRRLVAKATQQ